MADGVFVVRRTGLQAVVTLPEHIDGSNADQIREQLLLVVNGGAAADTAALLERRAGLVEEPRRIDYPTGIKRWRAFADQARQMAERWEHLERPLTAEEQHRRVAGSSQDQRLPREVTAGPLAG